MGTWVEFWKESVRKEDAMRNKWSDTYGVDFKPKKHRNLPSINCDSGDNNTSLAGMPKASRYSNNGVSKLSLTSPDLNSYTPTNLNRTASNGGYYQHSTQVAGVGNPVYGRYSKSSGYDPSGELPTIVRKSPYVSMPLPARPAAGSAGHSPKNGHYVNGHLYSTASHKSMMTRHEIRMQREAGNPTWFRDTI